MDIAFNNKRLRDMCESEELLNKQFHEIVVRSIKGRLADLRAAASLTDVVVGNPRETATKPNATMCIDLVDGYRLWFRANHAKPPVRRDGQIDWSAVSRIKILSIGKDDA